MFKNNTTKIRCLSLVILFLLGNLLADSGIRKCDPFPLACAKTREEVIRIINGDASILSASVGSDGLSVLHIAIYNRSPEVFFVLLDLGANPNAVTVRGVSVLKAAIDVLQVRRMEIVMALLEKGVEVSQDIVYYARLLAAIDPKNERVFRLLEKNYKVKHPGEDLVYMPIYTSSDIIQALTMPSTCFVHVIRHLLAYGAVVTDEVIQKAIEMETTSKSKGAPYGEIAQVVNLLINTLHPRT